mmetsp:Transcript_13316/g.49806  ORF Transcript_13316/g.49806 Transcript_13316/m.49806 type:complete len:202 (-) Transcript_13316:1602-2207(-)
MNASPAVVCLDTTSSPRRAPATFSPKNSDVPYRESRPCAPIVNVGSRDSVATGAVATPSANSSVLPELTPGLSSIRHPRGVSNVNPSPVYVDASAGGQSIPDNDSSVERPAPTRKPANLLLPNSSPGPPIPLGLASLAARRASAIALPGASSASCAVPQLGTQANSQSLVLLKSGNRALCLSIVSFVNPLSSSAALSFSSP